MKRFLWKFGVRYNNGKILFFRANSDGSFKGNPGEATPNWAVDIREIIAMCFAGVGGLAFLCMGHIAEAQTILVGLMMYATGRTVPGGKAVVTDEQLRRIIAELRETTSKT